MCVFLISPVPIAEPLTSELIDTPVFYNLAPRPIKYRVSVPIPSYFIGARVLCPSLSVYLCSLGEKEKLNKKNIVNSYGQNNRDNKNLISWQPFFKWFLYP